MFCKYAYFIVGRNAVVGSDICRRRSRLSVWSVSGVMVLYIESLLQLHILCYTCSGSLLWTGIIYLFK